ncbi:MAG: globin, partial [Sulfurimonas sp.]|nr:globin [Sulfurimonas sp.]
QLGTRPGVQIPNPKIYEHLGEEGMRKMVSDHYDIMVQSSIKGLFPPTKEGLEKAKQHSANFLIQISGGPRFYEVTRGEPMMVGRHSPFKITQEARIVWLESYIQVLQKLDMSDELKQSYWDYINIFSIWMMNSHED